MTSTFADQKARPTTGLVTTLYGSAAAKSGSDICWAWGASRIIDALEMLPQTGIDPTKVAVTGCSYAGKGALAMGAFDERVILTVMEEGGSGGSALWRVSSAEAAMGQNIQEATEIVGEANWEGQDFYSLFNGKSKTSAPVDKLIADQHMMVAICAPRACLLIENDIDWLGPLAAYGGGVAGREVYDGPGNQGPGRYFRGREPRPLLVPVEPASGPHRVHQPVPLQHEGGHLRRRPAQRDEQQDQDVDPGELD